MGVPMSETWFGGAVMTSIRTIGPAAAELTVFHHFGV